MEALKTEQIEKLTLGLQPLDDNTILILSSAAEWIENNTTFVFNYDDIQNTPSSIKLFLIKFFEIMSLPCGVSSESIEGLSQSFNNANKSDLIRQLANELLDKWLLNDKCFVAASKRW